MNIPKLPAGTRSFLWGAAVGAISLAIVGFNWGGWMTGPTSEKFAAQRADAAIVSALAPVCVAQFQKSADAPANLAVLKKTDSWDQGDYVSKGGWATMPGSTAEPNGEVATACAAALNKLVL
jgi:alpha/beta superfamily hydrolase